MSDEERRQRRREIRKIDIGQYQIQEKPAPEEIDKALKEIEQSRERKKVMKL